MDSYGKARARSHIKTAEGVWGPVATDFYTETWIWDSNDRAQEAARWRALDIVSALEMEDE